MFRVDFKKFCEGTRSDCGYNEGLTRIRRRTRFQINFILKKLKRRHNENNTLMHAADMIHVRPRNPDSKFSKFILLQHPKAKRCHKNPQILCLFLSQKSNITRQPEKTLFLLFSSDLRPFPARARVNARMCVCLFEQFSFAQIEK